MTHPEDFAAISAAGAPAFSRDGQTLFHLRGSGMAQVWALDLATGADRQLTFHDEAVAMLRRSPVDDRLIYGFDRGGDELQQLWLLDPDAPEPRALTANPTAIHDFGGWSPDGARFAYAANDRDPAHFDVHVQDIPSGTRQRVFHGSNMVAVADFRSDGMQLALLNDRGFGDMSLLLLDLASDDAREFDAPCNWRSVRWARDGRTLMALTDAGGSDFMRLCRLDPATGSIAVVYEADGRDVEAWALSPDARTLATVENDRGYAVLRIGPISGERPIVTGLPRGIASELAWAPDSGALAFSAGAPTEPSSLWLWRDGAAHVVWRPDPPLDPAGFVDYELVEWPSFDGTRIPGWLGLPRGTIPAGGHPAIVWVHGGPVSQTRPNFRPDIQMLLAQGFAVLLPNVRGSTGYGRAYTESDDVERRLDSVTDLAHARHWLAAHPAIDGERIGIMGQSYGGFMVMSAITEHPELWRAAVNYYGIADFETLLAGTGAWRRNHRAAEYGDPERDAGLFARISPIHRIERVRCAGADRARDPRPARADRRERAVRQGTARAAEEGFVRNLRLCRAWVHPSRRHAAHLSGGRGILHGESLRHGDCGSLSPYSQVRVARQVRRHVEPAFQAVEIEQRLPTRGEPEQHYQQQAETEDALDPAEFSLGALAQRHVVLGDRALVFAAHVVQAVDHRDGQQGCGERQELPGRERPVDDKQESGEGQQRIGSEDRAGQHEVNDREGGDGRDCQRDRRESPETAHRLAVEQHWVLRLAQVVAEKGQRPPEPCGRFQCEPVEPARQKPQEHRHRVAPKMAYPRLECRADLRSCRRSGKVKTVSPGSIPGTSSGTCVGRRAQHKTPKIARQCADATADVSESCRDPMAELTTTTG